MSRIYFHSPEATAEVRGSERAYMGVQISDWFSSTIDLPRHFEKEAPCFSFIPKDSYLQNSLKILDFDNWLEFTQSLRVWIRSLASDSYFVVGNYKIDLFGAQLNTAYLMGSDPVKLMARLHGQCELHCYIEAQNREWLAEIIKRGLGTGIYRLEQGWESVISLLENGCDSPVVTSYSVCEQFPNYSVADFNPPLDEDGEENWDSWYDLTPEAQWNLAMQGLRSESGRSLELDPKTWETFYFSHGWDAFKLNQLLSVPQSKWNDIAKAFSETQLPATEAWSVAFAKSQD